MFPYDHCRLFTGISKTEMERLFTQVPMPVRTYEKDAVLAFEGDECHTLGILVSGEVRIVKAVTPSRQVVIDTLAAGELFGEAILFADEHQYPATIIATHRAQVIYLDRQDVLTLSALSATFTGNFIASLSNKILLLNRRLRSLGLGSIRQKVVNELLELYAKQKSLHLHSRESREEMARRLGIPRPSLSRELGALRDRGWIDFDRDTIEIKALDQLHACLEA